MNIFNLSKYFKEYVAGRRIRRKQMGGEGCHSREIKHKEFKGEGHIA
jgi:hypothetical protein